MQTSGLKTFGQFRFDLWLILLATWIPSNHQHVKTLLMLYCVMCMHLSRVELNSEPQKLLSRKMEQFQIGIWCFVSLFRKPNRHKSSFHSLLTHYFTQNLSTVECHSKLNAANRRPLRIAIAHAHTICMHHHDAQAAKFKNGSLHRKTGTRRYSYRFSCRRRSHIRDCVSTTTSKATEKQYTRVYCVRITNSMPIRKCVSCVRHCQYPGIIIALSART